MGSVRAGRSRRPEVRDAGAPVFAQRCVGDARGVRIGVRIGSARYVEPPLCRATASAARCFPPGIAVEKNLVGVAEDEVALTARYVQRTALLGFPDTIVVRFVAVGAERSSIALYSRSKFGYSDLGANKARLERWLAALAREVPAVK